MAGFVVRSGSEEASRGSFLPRFLGFLLLFLVLAHSATAGVFGRGTKGNAQEPYLFGRTSDVTQDRGVVLTSDNKNKFKHHNDPAYNKHDNNKYGSKIHTYNDLKSLFDDENRNTIKFYSQTQYSNIRIPIGFLLFLFVSALYGCLWMCSRITTVVNERSKVVFRHRRTRGAEDAPEAQDRQADAVHVCPEATPLRGN
ncbi:uncharacterized protein LOC122263123 [Penaeus japonicus]|uniref:uncharacterized protein LOC122263123 n=1 Tax=Penaeus japonicus TaxID=27405 RepID=UPI001C70B746|nr:uncharacterized protein LOC122263123 [Penaeus japonicus]